VPARERDQDRHRARLALRGLPDLLVPRRGRPLDDSQRQLLLAGVAIGAMVLIGMMRRRRNASSPANLYTPPLPKP
jgi:hypothetical protein